MSRLPKISREVLDSEGQRIWDRIGESRGGLHGPYEALIRLPKLAERMADLGDYFRQQGLLSGADRELAILAAAREMGSRYEWARHEKLARDEGVRGVAIEAVRNMLYGNLEDRELVIVEVVQTLFRTKLLPSRLYERAMSELGADKLVELISLAGFYCAIAFLLLGFEVALPEGAKAPF